MLASFKKPVFITRNYTMAKFLFSLVLCAAVLVPSLASAQCGCNPAPAPACCAAPAPTCCAPRQRTRLKLVKVQKQVTRCKRVCTTDCCGCPTRSRVRVQKCVTRLALVRVPVEPRTRCCRPARTRCCPPAPTCNTCAATPCGCS